MRDMLLVLNFDNDFSRVVARKLRSEHVYCKVVPHHITPAEVQRQNPAGLILAGGVTGRGGQGGSLDDRLLDLGLPVLALGSAARTLCESRGGQRLDLVFERRVAPIAYAALPLFAGIEPGERWLEHARHLALPAGFVPAAEAEGYIVGFAHQEKPLFGLQFQIEQNDPDGLTMLSNFALGICGCTPWWGTEAFVERAKEEIHRVSEGGQALCAVSGGLDSTVCALLAHQAIGERLHCMLVDTGLLRQGEAESICQSLAGLGLSVRCVTRQAEVLAALSGLTDTNAKVAAVQAVVAAALQETAAQIGGCAVLIQGTNYTDVMLRQLPAAETEKLGGMRIYEPLRELFRDEVLRVGELLELPTETLHRQPFPFAGLAVRIFGAVTTATLATVRAVDAVLSEEVAAAGLERKLWKYYGALAPEPGAPADEMVALLRAVNVNDTGVTPARLPYDLLERAVARILKEVPGIARVLYDVTPATRIETQ